MSDQTAFVDYDSVERETDEAIQFNIADELVWLPKSQIDYDDETIELPEWLAIKKGLI